MGTDDRPIGVIGGGALGALLRLLLVSAVVAGCVAPRPPTPAREPEDGGRRELPPTGEPILLPGQASPFIPTGPEDQALVTARIVAVDIQGKITVESERGPADAWVTDSTRFHFGDPVQVRIIVRTGRLESTPGASLSGKATAPRWTEPGDHAIVIGRILSVDQRGTIAVDSPRGPIRVWVTLAFGGYRVGDVVEVRTRVLPAP